MLKQRLLAVLMTPALLALSACVTIDSEPLPAPPKNLYQDQLFFKHLQGAPLTIETPEQIFNLTNEMKVAVNKAVNLESDFHSINRDLIDFIFSSTGNQLLYQTGATLTAEQTYATQNANCLSLSILTYALAQYLNIGAKFQQVHIPEYWTMQRGYNMLTGHINIKLVPRSAAKTGQITLYTSRPGVVVDFDPQSRKEPFSTSDISKQRVLAMFYNNKGALALVKKNYALAYAYFKQATLVDPKYSSGWGNMAVLYRINNELVLAERAYSYALSVEPKNKTSKGNLAILYRLTKRDALAEKLEKEILKDRLSNPYYHLSLGNEAFNEHNYRQALYHFKKAQKLNNRLHEVHFGLAKAHFKLGSVSKAYRHLGLAKRYATHKSDEVRYQGKLNRLSASQVFRN